MAKPQLPSPAEHARLWAALDKTERRTIQRAVVRGEALDNRKHARLAVGLARQQQRYWRWAWVVGPLASLLLAPRWAWVVLGALLLGIQMGGISWFRYRKAVAAEEANLERIGKRR